MGTVYNRGNVIKLCAQVAVVFEYWPNFHADKDYRLPQGLPCDGMLPILNDSPSRVGQQYVSLNL